MQIPYGRVPPNHVLRCRNALACGRLPPYLVINYVAELLNQTSRDRLQMRELTNDEFALRDKRRAGFDAFFEESRPVLMEFVERLELPEPHSVLLDAAKFLGSVDVWMRDQVIGPDERNWIGTRMGYFIGEFFNQRLGGYWFLDEDTESSYFLHYVVGKFTAISDYDARISPFALANWFVTEKPGRSLTKLVAEVEDGLRSMNVR
jgi:hypothetical protein